MLNKDPQHDVQCMDMLQVSPKRKQGPAQKNVQSNDEDSKMGQKVAWRTENILI